jgi:hypothetical protein
MLRTRRLSPLGGHISTRTVIRRLHHQGMRARRPIKRPQLTLRHRHARFDWSHDHLGWTIRTWRRVHWSVSRYFWPVRLPSRTYKSNLQSKEKQPQTVTPPLPKAVVPKIGDNARPHEARIVQHFYSKRLFRKFHGLRCRQT